DVFLAAGSVASTQASRILVQQRSVPSVEDDLSWRRGYLTFHDTLLATAVDELNRYNKHKIVIQDPQVAAIRISGTFRAVNYRAFVRVLGEGFGIRSQDGEDTTTLTGN